MEKNTVRKILHSGMSIPRIVRPVIRMLYDLGVLIYEGSILARKLIFVEPVFRSIAVSVGRGLRIERLPYIRGRGRIFVGSDVYISGKIGIGFSSHASVLPELSIGDHTFIGHQCSFSLA